MKCHVDICGLQLEQGLEANTPEDVTDKMPQRVAMPSPNPMQSPMRKRPRLIESYVQKTSSSEKEKLDIQVARFFFANNIPFRTADHEEFHKLLHMLRPGYKPPSRKDISDKMIEKVHDSLQDDCRTKLRNSTVSMTLDGWSNIQNEPIVCATITTAEGEVYITDTIDTSGNSHTAEYLAGITKTAIQSTYPKYGCKVGSFVTDNAANMAKMRNMLGYNDELSSVVTYGCGAHQMNLLSKDIEISGVKEHVVKIVKYFRNTHLPAAWYKAAGGRKLVVPQEVRWNSLVDTLQCYLDNWAVLLLVCENLREGIDKQIAAKVKDFALKRNAEDYLEIMVPIAVALDKLQQSRCTLSQAVDIWSELETKLTPLLSTADRKKFIARKSSSLTDAHYLAYILDPKVNGNTLYAEHVDSAMLYCREYYPDCISTVVKFRARSAPFKAYMFEDSYLVEVSSVEWWMAMEGRFNEDFIQLIKCLLCSVASSSDVERAFSTFGLVHSKLRNRLGVAKAAKLVFIYRVLNVNIASGSDN